MTKELNSLNELGEEKSFELSVIELVGYVIVVICIYRSLDGKTDTFFNKLEMIIQKLIVKQNFNSIWRLEYKFPPNQPTYKGIE
jgi:hypothetical protein